MTARAPNDPRPATWPYRSDPPQRYWDNYRHYIRRGGMIRLEDDIRGFTAGEQRSGDMSRFYFFCVAFDELMKEGIKGDLAELGVYRGHTATMLATMARRMQTTAYLLDTFEGFNASDLRGIDAGHRMQFSDTSLEAVRALVGDDNVRYIKGYFPDSASMMPADPKFALVHVDCDLYTPLLAALNYFYPRLVPGGYLIIHDYFSLAWDGAERAVDEFFADKPEPVIPLTDGCGSAVIRRTRAPARDGNWLMNKRLNQFSASWTSAGNGGLSGILGNGWSGEETWGLWGIGAAHELNLHISALPSSDILFEAQVRAALVGSRQSQTVDVVVDGTSLETWQFSKDANDAIRSVRIPPSALAVGDWGYPVVRLELRPRDVRPFNALAPDSNDSRSLGVALTRIRRGAA